MRIALGQIQCRPQNIAANLEAHITFIEQAITQDADLIVFPELSLTGDMVGNLLPDSSVSPEMDALTHIAALSHDIDIVIGLAEPNNAHDFKRYNAAFYFAGGMLIQRHRKLFLVNYSVFEEERYYIPGNALQTFDTRHGRTSMLICNDVWHAPAPYVAAMDGAELLLVPSNSARGILQDKLYLARTWETMNRNYSATMGFFTVFVNCVGVRESVHSAYRYWGGSEIIAPTGDVVVKAPYDDEALVIGEIHLADVARQRFEVPILRDARVGFIAQEFNRLAAERLSQPLLEDTNDNFEVLEPDQPRTA